MATLPHSWAVQPAVQSALGAVGAALAFVLFAAPAPTFRRIIARRDTECFDGTPYVLAAVQCAAWVLYCAITPGRMAPGVTNGIGVVVESCYCAVFMRYVHPGPRRAAFAKALALACSCFAVGTLFLFLGVPPELRTPAVGYTADVLNIAVYSAPLGVMSTVVRTRSVEFMPLGLSLATLLCAAAWSVYAVYVADATILLPNVLGVALALAQLALYARYARATPRAAEAEAATAGLLDEAAGSEGGMTPRASSAGGGGGAAAAANGGGGGGGYAPPRTSAVEVPAA